jgi:hypothetical protein
MRPTYHLRVFIISLVIIALALAGALFGVRVEAVVPASGTITARELREARARLSGLVELGWYEAEVARPDGAPLPVRVDDEGNGVGLLDGATLRVRQGELTDGELRLTVRERRLHRLQAGELLWPGQPLAQVRDDALRLRLATLDDQIKDHMQRSEPCDALIRERDRLREHHARATVFAPGSGERWLLVELRAAPAQKVNSGEVVAVIVAADPQTGQPRDLVARLDVEEKHWAGVAAGEKVRLHSAVYNSRHFGSAEAVIDRLEPSADTTVAGDRRFHALAPITQSPVALPLGSSFQAEIVVGRKLIYRVILEH